MTNPIAEFPFSTPRLPTRRRPGVGGGSAESKDLAAGHPEILAKLQDLAAQASTPAVEGTFSRTDGHERDRRAKTGQQDNPNAPDPGKGKKKGMGKAK